MNKSRNNGYLKAFGENLRSIRKSKALSMEKLALIANIEYSQIFDIEHGKINTTISTIYLLAKALNIKPSELFSFSYSD
ncbi:helix-turn-helix domain-containing protein [Pedobacter sp.]|uniref:helix-turn-helix domain-containing protein n=1 Tax=Pedobacter sp. TaxID=1411316 RepID=UPI003BA89874